MILSDEVIAARAGWSRVIARGEVLRLIDLEGKQAVDFLCYNAGDSEDRYAAADTMKINGNIFIRKGSRALLGELQSDVHGGRRHLRLPRHHRRLLLLGAQPPALRQARRPELPAELPATSSRATAWGRATWSPTSISSCTCRSAPDGAMDMGPSISKPGDYVDLRAEMDVLAVDLQLPADEQPGERLQPDAGARDRLPALGQKSLQQLVEEALPALASGRMRFQSRSSSPFSSASCSWLSTIVNGRPVRSSNSATGNPRPGAGHSA